MFLDGDDALEQMIDLFGKARRVVRCHFEKLDTHSDVAEFGFDIGEATFYSDEIVFRSHSILNKIEYF